MSHTSNKTTYNILDNLWKVVFGLIFAIAFGRLSWDKFEKLYFSDLLLFVLVIILTIITFGLLMAYLIATNMELNILNDYLGDVAPRVPPRTYVVSILLAIAFGFLVTQAGNILFY
jgi:hypothetical protein